ncbi:response regulator [Catenuloplanes indicus]|uniref:CheY-like chemotaxis protein n=1 Tax=Catenuloplanes indicus TaxID=137267 RepID=A0AAE3VXG7_9ACTN|nr:response regulator [Catenuloplanes indicus]MDQ0365092.1 CheY-like chemotaxis protein [Catenuloplanes indicus]
MATIVIADDDPDAADLVAYAFEGAGHSVRTVLDGASALRLITQLQPDIAVLDQNMPRMTGSEVASAVRAHSPVLTTRILMITGRSERTMTAPVDRFLSKPVTPRQLTLVVADMLQDPAPGGTAADSPRKEHDDDVR